ncbi:MAG: acetylxylan esterase [Fimbriimonadales bacterium]
MNLPRPYIPPEFDEFWHRNVSEAEAAPLDYELAQTPSPPHPTHKGQTKPGTITTQHEISTFTFRGILGETLNGWIAFPGSRASSPLRSPEDRGGPAFLWIPPYGRESLMPNQYGTREGWVSLSFNFFGYPAFHQEKYAPPRGYFREGVLDKETWIFRRMFQNALIALRVLCDLPEVDPGRVGSMGLSQGAGMSIWLGAWSDRVKAVCADMPFLGVMHETLLKNVYRYPLKELKDLLTTVPNGEETVLRTVSYFDTLNQAALCSRPTLVSLGLRDPAVKPVQARSIFEALPGPKKLVTYNWGHDWHPEMIENNRLWLEEYVL